MDHTQASQLVRRIFHHSNKSEQTTMLCEVAKVLVLITKLRNINSQIGIDGAIFTVSSLVLTFQSKVQA
jgi:hypothetical protein